MLFHCAVLKIKKASRNSDLYPQNKPQAKSVVMVDIRFVFMNRDGEIVKQQSINRIIRRVVEAVVMNTKNYIYIVAG